MQLQWNRHGLRIVSRTGGTALGGSYNAAAAAMAAVAQASALTGPRLVRCDVCNATFSGDADMQQHLQASVLRGRTYAYL